MINQNAIEQIKDRLDIVEVVREFVPNLRKAGRSWKACCPFHQERTASFTVSQEKQLWYCFGSCHDGGDLFKFLMKAESLSFSEAAQRLAERAGVTWKPAAEQLGPRERERLQLKDALEFAKDFYRKILESSPEADSARRYLTGRGVSPESREKFELGFSLQDGTSFLDAALRKGLAPGVLAKAGLLAEREGGRYRDYFRSRILFPIRDARGAVSGFGGRAMGDFEPKYLNSPETPVFAKGRTLYGLFQAGPTIRKEGRAVLVEGYMDVVGCHQHGLTAAVAPLGTAVTPDHAKLLKRYAEEALLVFDPDAAGAAASVRGGEGLLEEGVFVRVGTVPDGLDPDDYLKAHGRPALDKALAEAKDLIEFQIDLALKRTPRPSSHDKARIAEQALETISKQPNAVLRGEALRKVAARLSLDEESLRSELRRQGRSRNLKPAPVSNPPQEAAEVPLAESELFRLLFKHPELVDRAKDLAPEDFSAPVCRQAWTAVRALLNDGAEGGGPDWPKRLLGRLDEAGSAWVSGLLVEDREYGSPEETLKKHLADFWRARRDGDRLKDLQTAVLAMAEGKAPMQEAVLTEYRSLLNKVKGSPTHKES